MIGAFLAAHPVAVELCKYGAISVGLGAGQQLMMQLLGACGIHVEDPHETARRRKEAHRQEFAMSEISALSTMLTARFGPNWMSKPEAREMWESRSRQLANI